MDGVVDTVVTLSVGSGKHTTDDFPVKVDPAEDGVLRVSVPRAESEELNRELQALLCLSNIVDSLDDWGVPSRRSSVNCAAPGEKQRMPFASQTAFEALPYRALTGSQMVANQMHGIEGIVDVDFDVTTVHMGEHYYKSKTASSQEQWSLPEGVSFVSVLAETTDNMFEVVAHATAHFKPDGGARRGLRCIVA